MCRRKGQSILEYIIVLTVIVAAIAYGATTYLKPAISTVIQSGSTAIKSTAARFPGAVTVTPPGTGDGGLLP